MRGWTLKAKKTHNSSGIIYRLEILSLKYLVMFSFMFLTVKHLGTCCMFLLAYQKVACKKPIKLCTSILFEKG